MANVAGSECMVMHGGVFNVQAHMTEQMERIQKAGKGLGSDSTSAEPSVTSSESWVEHAVRFFERGAQGIAAGYGVRQARIYGCRACAFASAQS